MKLGTLLLRNATISPSQLEAALRTQILCGGRLGTNLVELEFLDLNGLTAHLGELYELPIATQSLLDRVTADTARLIDAGIAEQLGAIPLGFLEPFRDALAVAMIDPGDTFAIEQLATLTGFPIAPYIVPELRAFYYLERLYGLTRAARYIRPGNRRLLTSNGERRRTQPPGGIAPPPPIRFVPRRRPGGSQQTVVPISAPPLIDYQTACDRVDTASHRDEIGQALLDYAIGRFAALVILLVRDGNALGWRSHTVGHPARPIGALSLPIGGVSALQTANDEGRAYRGPPPSAGHPTESLLWTALAVEPSSDMFAAPVLVQHRVVNLIYAHPLPDGFDAASIDELRQLAERVSGAYARLIQQTKNR
jgi:hypothetical protein